MQFTKDIAEGKKAEILNFLKLQNKGAILATAVTKTLVLMDATGSMSHLL
jgi:hypothetical protein